MFYVRKPTKIEPVSLVREATPVELHNYKNRFIVQQPTVDVPDQEVNSGCECNCNCQHNLDELLFVNINCDLDLDNIGSNE